MYYKERRLWKCSENMKCWAYIICISIILQMYFISRGEVQMYAGEDDTTLLATMGTGDFFGEISCFIGCLTTATVMWVLYSDVASWVGMIKLLTVLIECLTILLEYIDLIYSSHRVYQTSRKAVYMSWTCTCLSRPTLGYATSLILLIVVSNMIFILGLKQTVTCTCLVLKI